MAETRTAPFDVKTVPTDADREEFGNLEARGHEHEYVHDDEEQRLTVFVQLCYDGDDVRGCTVSLAPRDLELDEDLHTQLKAREIISDAQPEVQLQFLLRDDNYTLVCINIRETLLPDDRGAELLSRQVKSTLRKIGLRVAQIYLTPQRAA